MSNRALIFFGLLLIINFNASASGGREDIQARDVNSRFDWTFLCKDANGNIRSLEYNEIFDITSDNEYQITINLKKKVYVYIYIADSQDNLFLLFPHDFSLFDRSYEVEKNYVIPEKDSWLSLLPDTHIQKFYIIATFNRQKELENLTRSYLALLDDPAATRNHKIRARISVHNKLINLELDSSFFIISAEKQLPIAGDVQTEYDSDDDDPLWSE